MFISAVGLLCLISVPSSSLMTVVWFSVVCVQMAFLAAFWAIPTEILSESTAAFAVGIINALASVAGFAGPYGFGYLNSRTGSPYPGFTVLMCCALASGMLMLLTPTTTRPRTSEITCSQ